MLVFNTSKGEKQFRPLAHIAEKTNGWILRYDTMNIVPDTVSAAIVIDMSGPVAEFDVDDVVLLADADPLVPIEVLDYAGKFEFKRTMRPDNPPGWLFNYSMTQIETPTIRIEREGNRSFLRIENSDSGKNHFLENIFKLDPSWKKVQVSAKIRTQNLQCGSEGWQNARIMITFTDAKGSKVGGYGECPQAKNDQDWTESVVVREIPEGAAGIRLQLGLFNASGIADFDDVSVTKAE